jgi:putative phosphoribosyl transferase
VLGLPRGGVPVAAEVARALDAALDIFVVRKLGTPMNPELGFGAVAEGDVVVVDELMCAELGIDHREVESIAARERAEVNERVARLRHGRPMIELAGRTVIIVDDGIATGGTVRAAIQGVRAHGAARVILAVPVASRETLESLRPGLDEAVALETPADLYAIGMWYDDFGPVDEAEVHRLLEGAAARRAPPVTAATPPEQPVRIDVGGPTLEGELVLPADATGVVLFAHGSGSSRRSPRNRVVAAALQGRQLGTLLVDLLSPGEELVDQATAHLRFDIPLLSRRLIEIVSWLRHNPATRHLPIGLFGASTGAAAALQAAAEQPAVAAVVSRGGRPDLAGDALERVRAPTRLIVGGRDEAVLALNQDAYARLRCDKDLVIVPDATHLFAEPGALERVAERAGEWLRRHLA